MIRTLQDFEASLAEPAPPDGLGLALQALWWQGKGRWAKAHDLVQDDVSGSGAWVHAHLHRVEGDDGNAAYWYRRAGEPVSRESLKQEWTSMVQTLLEMTVKG